MRKIKRPPSFAELWLTDANRESVRLRFEANFTKSEADQCWLWTGGRDANGYGRISFAGKTRIATRVAMLLAGHPIPAGSFICHRCDNPPCVNPNHLWVGDPEQNFWDAMQKGRAKPFVRKR